MHAIDPKAITENVGFLADRGHVPEHVEDQAADRVPVVGGELGVEHVAQLVDGHATMHAHRTTAQGDHIGVVEVELVVDVAHEFFE